MTLEVEVSESDVVDQNEYADWYCSRLEMERVGDAGDGQCKVRMMSKPDIIGTFDLMGLSVEWPDGSESDISQEIADSADWAGPCEDFDVSTFMWGVDSRYGTPVNVLFGVS